MTVELLQDNARRLNPALCRLALVVALTGSLSVKADADLAPDKHQCAYVTAGEAETLLGTKLARPPQMMDTGMSAFCAYTAGEKALLIFVNRNIDVSTVHDTRRGQTIVRSIGDFATWEVVDYTVVPETSPKKPPIPAAYLRTFKGTTSLTVNVMGLAKPPTLEQTKAVAKKALSRLGPGP